MKKLLIALAVILALIGGFFAFNSYIYNEKQGDGPIDQNVPIRGELEEGGEADPSVMKLDMNTWIWVSAQYNDGRVVKPKQEGQFTITFSPDGKFVAYTDCNSMGGKYVAGKDGKITFSDIISTQMYCEGSQETEFASLLNTTSGYHFTTRGQMILDLKFDSGSVIFR